MEDKRPKILVLDDDQELRTMLARYLAEQGFQTRAVSDSAQLDRLLQREPFDVLVLDLMMPGEDGLAVCRRLRAQGETIPIIMLTARGDPVDRVVGLEMGADDYLVKPFAFAELLVRIRTLLRRGPIREPDVFQIADLEIDVPKRRVTRSGQRIDLTAKEFALLHLMSKRVGQVLSRPLIASQVWDMNFDSDTNVVDVAVRRLRAKIDDPYDVKLIHTIRSMGYVLEDRG